MHGYELRRIEVVPTKTAEDVSLTLLIRKLYFETKNGFLPQTLIFPVRVCVIFPFILDDWLVDVPAGITQEEC